MLETIYDCIWITILTVIFYQIIKHFGLEWFIALYTANAVVHVFRKGE